MKIPLSSPDVGDKEISAVVKVLRSPALSLGPKLVEFEQKIADFTGMPYAVAVNSGTSALHLIVRALGIGKGDEVITTPFSFIATANCLLFEKAIPVFVDIDPMTLNIDAEKIESRITKRTKAILAVDVFGHPAEWSALKKIARKHKLKLIEDSAEALGAEYKGKKAGSLADAGIFAFYPNKQITTGEGGVIVTRSRKLAELCSSMRNQGRGEKSSWLNHVRLGYNYRISDINCALGLIQMERLEEILVKRKSVADQYNKALKGVEEITLPYDCSGMIKSWFVYVIRLKEIFSQKHRDRLITQLSDKGISCGKYFTPIHLQPFYREMFGFKPGDFPVTEGVAKRTIALPFFTALSKDQVCYVARELKHALTRLGI